MAGAPGLRTLWTAYVRTYDRIGNDPYVGRRLVSLLVSAGARPVRNQWLFFGSCSGHADFVTHAENLAGILESARAAILEAEILEAAFIDRTVAEIREWSRRPRRRDLVRGVLGRGRQAGRTGRSGRLKDRSENRQPSEADRA